MILQVRKLAAIDLALHGPRFILIEFGLGVAGCALIGALSLWSAIRLPARGISWQFILGVALLWIALNYVPLLLHTIDLAKRGSARQEAAFELGRPELVRRYGLLQLWILVPLAVVVFAIAQRGTRAV